MTSVLSYPSADPFAANLSSPDPASHYPSPPFSPPYHRPQMYSPDTAMSSSQTITDEFGSYRPADVGPSQSTSAARPRPPTMPLPLPEPTASTSHAHASSHSHTAQQSRAANRRSHNPTTTLGNASPPKAEYLTDEYVLHPSVYAYKQAHPRRPMIGFGPYVLLQTLGEGEFGKVKLGVHTDYGVEVAIKLIRRGSLDDEVRAGKVEREIDVLKTLKHPNIVRMFDVIDTEKYIGIVMEFAGGGELFEHILANRYLKEKDAAKLFAQLISGVDYLHRKHIVHRDLKLENLLLDKHRNIIITDFGFANRFEHEQDDLMATSCGSPCYAAPELVVSEGLYVGSAVDIWSCGVILYAMLSGYLPYDDDPANPDGDNINLLYKYIMNTKLNFPEHMSPSAKSLLQIMLVPNPEHRCTIHDIMSHPWLEAYRDMFARSVDEHEYVFQDAMYKKSQQAKRELAERKRVQAEARDARMVLARSQSSVPGTSVTASMLDYNRRREQRHHSALPGTTTMPEYLNNAGQRTPPLNPRLAAPPPTVPDILSPVSMPTPTIPTPPMVPSPSGSPRRHSEVGLPHTDSTVALENEPVVEAVVKSVVEPVAPAEPKPKPPMSANKNRHTIQVEYDGEASYQRMLEALETKQKATLPEENLAPPMPDVRQGGVSDIEMESGSSDNGHFKAETVESVPEEPEEVEEAVESPVELPVVEETIANTVPSTPSKKTVRPEIASPSTPRASIHRVEDVTATPRAAIATTPKASLRDRKRYDSMPSTVPAPSVPEPRLGSSGLPRPAKRERYRKGMSLDKFGLAKLLGQTSSSVADENRPAPPSASASAISVQSAQQKRASAARPRTGDSDSTKEKKTRRRTLQLMVHRSGTREERTPPTPATPLSARDMNPIPPKSKPSPPTVATRQPVSAPGGLGHNSPSVVTVDALAAQAAGPPAHKTASSNAAKKVMDWFRRKSLAKDTLTGLKSARIKSDSQSSFVRVSPSRPRALNESTANLAMSSMSSIGHTAEGNPNITVTSAAVPEPAPVESSSRSPLGSAASKTNIQSTSDLLSPRVAAPLPERSKSHRASPSPPSVKNTVAPTVRPRSGSNSEDSKLRVHTGLVDQSALSSKSPAEVMAEVMKVLQEMGMDIKRENEYRLRCTRVRRRKAGATTSLGLGSVMSVGSGLSPFGLMGNASMNRTDSRGLPIPQSPSSSLLSGGGLKGMLLRRGSSYTSTHPAQLPRSESEPFSSPSAGNTPNLASTEKMPTAEPLYGEHSVDSGDEVKFAIELCRIKNLPGLYLLNIKRLRGSVWSFKFIYQTVLERTSTLTH